MSLYRTERVRFKLPVRHLEDSRMREVIREAFYMAESEMPVNCRHSTDEITITCRAAQFGHFIVLRNGRGLQNLVKELEPELLPIKGDELMLDVSQRKPLAIAG